MKTNDSNNRVQGTRHKVSGPLTRDVRPDKMRKHLLAIGLFITIAGAGIYALSFWRYASPQKCVVDAPPVIDSGHARLLVTTAQGGQLEPHLQSWDHTIYKKGDPVLVFFPLMDDPYVISGYSMVMHYIIDYPTILAGGLVLLAINETKSRTSGSSVPATRCRVR